MIFVPPSRTGECGYPVWALACSRYCTENNKPRSHFSLYEVIQLRVLTDTGSCLLTTLSDDRSAGRFAHPEVRSSFCCARLACSLCPALHHLMNASLSCIQVVPAGRATYNNGCYLDDAQ